VEIKRDREWRGDSRIWKVEKGEKEEGTTDQEKKGALKKKPVRRTSETSMPLQEIEKKRRREISDTDRGSRNHRTEIKKRRCDKGLEMPKRPEDEKDQGVVMQGVP